MNTQPRLSRRANSATYYFRAKIPADLAKHYAPKREITFSLRTRDKAEAIRKVRLESARLEAEFTTMRQRYRLDSEIAVKFSDTPSRPLARMTDEQIQRICGLWTRSVLMTDDANREAGEIDDSFDDWEQITTNSCRRHVATCSAETSTKCWTMSLNDTMRRSASLSHR